MAAKYVLKNMNMYFENYVSVLYTMYRVTLNDTEEDVAAYSFSTSSPEEPQIMHAFGKYVMNSKTRRY
jgi:hypothetical protein